MKIETKIRPTDDNDWNYKIFVEESEISVVKFNTMVDVTSQSFKLVNKYWQYDNFISVTNVDSCKFWITEIETFRSTVTVILMETDGSCA